MLDGAVRVGGWLVTLDGPFLTKRKIILDGPEHLDGWLLTLEGPPRTRGASGRITLNARWAFFNEKKKYWRERSKRTG